MRKFFRIFVLIFALNLCLFNLTCCGTEEKSEKMFLKEPGATERIENYMTESEMETLKLAEPSLKTALEDNFVIKIYRSWFWDLAELPFEKILSESESGCCDYVILSSEPLFVWEFLQNNERVFAVSENYIQHFADYSNLPMPIYITDLIYSDGFLTYQGAQYRINGIACFDNSVSQHGIIVYLITDQGRFVRYYEYLNSEAILFTEEEFQPFAVKYNDYISSPEYNYDENGYELYRGTFSFVQFLQEQTNWSPTTVEENVSAPDKSSTAPILLGLIGGGALLLGGILLFCLSRRKKRGSQN